MSDYRVLLYYKYVDIENPHQFRDEHQAMCDEIGMRGRILVSEEGINGTASGTVEQTDEYMRRVHEDPRFSDLWFKINEADDYAHKKMIVRYRSEIVSLNLEENWGEDIDPNELTGKHLESEEFREVLLDDEYVVLDTRNDYEYDLGHFRGAIRPDIKAFRELPQWVQDNKELFMDKKVAVYCTGGVRCEKFSGWMLKEGFEDVVQLNGGIENYGQNENTKGDLWDGKMLVFDERISVPINRVEPTIVGKDYFDGSPCERYVNCANPECNERILCSEENEAKYLRGCSAECRAHPRNRYVEEHGLNESEVQARLEAIGESLPQYKA